MILPEIGKTYNFYDDGKITFSRQYKCAILDVIPFKKIAKRQKQQWRQIVNKHPWLFKSETDYFILGEIKDSIDPNHIFFRTIDNNWFSTSFEFVANNEIDIRDTFCVGGLLDVDGTITENLLYNYEN